MNYPLELLVPDFTAPFAVVLHMAKKTAWSCCVGGIQCYMYVVLVNPQVSISCKQNNIIASGQTTFPCLVSWPSTLLNSFCILWGISANVVTLKS